MPLMTTDHRLTKIKADARAIATHLIQTRFMTTDQDLQQISKRLAPFQNVLAAKGIDAHAAEGFLTTGFKLVRFKPDDKANDRAEAIRFLNAFLDRLETMRPLLGF